MLLHIKSLFQTLHENDILYCHWKSNEHVAAGLQGDTDIDMLVSPNHKDALKKIFRLAQVLQAASGSHHNYKDVEDYIGFDETTGKLFHLHVHYRIITGKKYIKEIEIPLLEAVLSTRKMEETHNVYIVEPHLEFAILCIRMALKPYFPTKKLDTDVRREYDYLVRQIDSTKLRACVDASMIQDIADIIYEIYIAYTHNEEVKISRLLKKLRIVWMRDVEKKSFLTQYAYIVKSLFHLLRLRILRMSNNRLHTTHVIKKRFTKSGLVIAFLGADGAGKSTVSNEIHKWLSWKIDSHTMYLGHPKSIVFKVMRTVCYNIRNIMFAYIKNNHCKKANVLSRNGSVVITDRYPQSQFKGINDGLLIVPKSFVSRLLEKVELYYYKRIEKEFPPTLVCKLHVSHVVAMQRKPDHNAQKIQRKIDIVQSLTFPQSVVCNISSDDPLEKVLLAVKQHIWKTIVKQNL